MSQRLISEGLNYLVESAADRAEMNAFLRFGDVLDELNPDQVQVIERPKGRDSGFPDFAYRVKSPSGKVIDIHVEYKLNKSAQMGSLRTWKFDGTKYSSPRTDEESQFIIDAMNSSASIVQGGVRMLSSFRQAADELGVGPVRFVGVGAANALIPSNQTKLRRELISRVLDINGDQVIGYIKGGFGPMIMRHYEKKFKENLKSGSNASVCLLMIGDRVWYLDGHRAGSDDIQEVANMLGVRSIDTSSLSSSTIDANLEVRLQMSNSLTDLFKSPRVDSFAAFRLLARTLRGGTKVI